MWVYIGTGSLNFVANMGAQSDTRMGRCSFWYPAHACRLYHTNTGLESGGAKWPKRRPGGPLWWEPCPIKGVQQERCRNCCGTRDTKARVKNWREKKRNEKCRKVCVDFCRRSLKKSHTYTHTYCWRLVVETTVEIDRRDEFSIGVPFDSLHCHGSIWYIFLPALGFAKSATKDTILPTKRVAFVSRGQSETGEEDGEERNLTG